MAEGAGSLSQAAQGLGGLPIFRQIGVLLGISVSIALGFAMVLWLQEPDYRPLYSNLSLTSTSDVVDELQQANIRYRLDPNTGTVLVPGDKLHLARLKLAASGLPEGGNMGFELLDKSGGMGVSRFMENAQYKRALEGELAKTITTIKGVKAARVHLAMPKRSAFITNELKPKASVLVKLAAGRRLEQEQVASIVRMVASSIIGLSENDVAVSDQQGRLLSSAAIGDMAASKSQFKFQEQLQKSYEQKIVALISPIVGIGKVQAKVTADIDFTQSESTKQSYHPDEKVMRSEQTLTETNSGGGAGGAPGALANAAPQGGGAGGGGGGASGSRESSVKNYELSKSIEYSKKPTGSLKFLTVAVVVDNRTKTADDGQVTSTPLTPQEMEKITQLVKHAIGFDEQRGDKLSIVNSAFELPPKIEDAPELPLWQKAWFWDIVKKSLGALFVLILALVIIRPLLRNLVKKSVVMNSMGGGAGGGAGGVNYPVAVSGGPGTMANVAGDGTGGQQGGANQANLNIDSMSPADVMRLKQEQLDSIKNMVNQDPSRVAAVLNNWIGDK